ncbi:MAG: calcineurin-like phosphoesterase family protein [Muribaculum sp.]|nr:calcineurin-like phosphoesterase family protein [Muribaculum sp.]
MRNISNYLIWMLMAAILPFTLAGCGSSSSEDEPNVDDFDIQFTLPTKIDVPKGGEFTFTVTNGVAPKMSDFMVVESASGVSYLCPIVNASATQFTVRFVEEVVEGSYKVYLKRDQRKKLVGQTSINIITKQIDGGDSTVYGLITAGDEPVAGVVVSDGIEVTTTDSEGVYRLNSAKKYGYVFMSIPSGFEAESDGVLPVLYRLLTSDERSQERADFKLNKVSGQDTYKVFFLGDMHLANRTGDANQFLEFTTDLNNYTQSHYGEKMYAITLGDMTWDLYWYDNKYEIADYLKTVNTQVKNLQIFHTMGNHDNDFKATSDFTAENRYRTVLAPTYYSFNIGKVHYVVLDDIDCSSYDGSTSRNYKKGISADQLSWLAKDLAYVPKSTPLIITMHAQVYKPVKSGGFKVDHDEANTNQFLSLIDGYKVNIVTGHTHQVYNIAPGESILSGRDIFEHNSGAICASWWWSGYLTPGIHIGTDGAPGGYVVWDINGTDMKWVFKPTGKSEDYQFRSYDLNKVSFTAADVPDMPAKVADGFEPYTKAYPVNSNNEVLINVWNYNPNWTITVTTEGGQSLTPTAVWAYDPLHIAALSVPRFNKSNLSSKPSFITEEFTHFFKVKAPDADTDLTITVKDEFGHTWIEQMQRPKAFSIEAYK